MIVEYYGWKLWGGSVGFRVARYASPTHLYGVIGASRFRDISTPATNTSAFRLVGGRTSRDTNAGRGSLLDWNLHASRAFTYLQIQRRRLHQYWSMRLQSQCLYSAVDQSLGASASASERAFEIFPGHRRSISSSPLPKRPTWKCACDLDTREETHRHLCC